jgi:hypothetical protein
MMQEKKRIKKGKFILLIGVVLLLLLGVSSILGGTAILVLNRGTDKDGYSLSDVYKVETSTYAFALWVEPLRVSSTIGWMNHEDIAQTKWVVKAVNPSKEIFVGWAKAANGENYLNGIQYETPPSWHWSTSPYHASMNIPPTVIYNEGAPSKSPTLETFWLESAHSSNTSTLNWDPNWPPQAGRNILIIMNADGSSNVEADLQLGFKVPIFGWLPYLLMPLGIIMCLGGIFLIRRRKRM